MARSVLAVTATAALLLAAACTAIEPGPSAISGPDLRGQAIEVAAVWTGAEQQAFARVLDEFERRTGATVRYTSGGNDLPVLVNSRIAGGSPPDVAFIAQPGVVNELARRGALVPLTGEAAATVRSNYSLAWQQLGTVDDTLFGVYFKVANKSVFWYRTDDFADAGVHPPRTWDDLIAVSRTLAESGRTPMACAGGDGWVLTDWFENALLRIGGPQKYDQLVSRQLPFTDRSVVESLRLLGNYWRSSKTCQGGSAGAVQVTFTQSIADVFGEKPRSSMLFEGDFVASEINKLGRSTVGTTAKFFNWPSIDGSGPGVVTAGDQLVQLRRNPAADAFVAFAASTEAARLMAEQGGFISANRNLASSAYPDETTRQLAGAVVGAQLLRFDLSDLTPQRFGGGTGASLWRLLQDFLSKPISPEVMARQLEDAAAADFGRAA